MSKPFSFLLIAALLTCTGCFTAAPSDALPKVPTQVAKSLPPVTLEQISDKNGHQVAQALEEEMNREQQQNTLNPR